MSEETCIFCKIVNKKIPSELIYEDGYVVCFMDISPASKGHCLIVSKKHYVMLHEMSNELSEKMMKAVRIISGSIMENLDADGYNLVMSNGRDAGQEVDHCHIHIIPRIKGDGINFHWNHVKYDDGEMKKIAKKIREDIKK